MSTKTTSLHINISSDMKMKFVHLSKEMGTNPSNLLKMMIAQAVNTGKITFSIDTNDDNLNSATKKLLKTPYEDLEWSKVEKASDLLKV